MPQSFKRHKSSRRCVLFSFHKLDAITGMGIPGAEFELSSCAKKCAAQNEISNGAGLVRFKLKPGRVYTLREIVTPTGYMPNQHVYIVMVNSGGCVFVDGVFTINPNLPNIPVRGAFFATKIDAATAQPLAGAAFFLSQNGTQIATSTSGINGILSFSNLTPGSYALRESAPPAGYLPNPNVFSVIVNQDGSVTIDGNPATGFTIDNTIQPFAFNVLKTNSLTGSPIAGAVFGLSSNGSEIAESTSDINGNLIFANLTPGAYTLREITPANGYSLNTDIFNVVVDSNGTVTVNGMPSGGFTITNTPILPLSQPPIVNSVFELDPMIEGSGEPGCQVMATFLQTSTTVSATVNASGLWFIPIPESLQPILAGQLISVVQTCAEALPSEPVIITVMSQSSINFSSSGDNSYTEINRHIQNLSSSRNFFADRI